MPAKLERHIGHKTQDDIGHRHQWQDIFRKTHGEFGDADAKMKTRLADRGEIIPPDIKYHEWPFPLTKQHIHCSKGQ